MRFLERPHAMFADCGVHSIWSEIQFPGPRHGTVLDRHLSEKRPVEKRRENSCLRGVHQPSHVDHASRAVGKCYP